MIRFETVYIQTPGREKDSQLLKKQLERAIEHYFQVLIDKYQLKCLNERAAGMGALKDYESQDLLIRIVNDKGIVSLEVGSTHRQDKKWDISLVKDYLDPPHAGSWNLSLQEQVKFLEENWEWFLQRFSESKIEKTMQALDQFASRRTKHLRCK